MSKDVSMGNGIVSLQGVNMAKAKCLFKGVKGETIVLAKKRPRSPVYDEFVLPLIDVVGIKTSGATCFADIMVDEEIQVTFASKFDLEVHEESGEVAINKDGWFVASNDKGAFFSHPQSSVIVKTK